MRRSDSHAPRLASAILDTAPRSTSAYFSSTTLRFTFSVGVSSPDSIENSVGQHGDPLDALELRQLAVEAVDDLLVERDDVLALHELVALRRAGGRDPSGGARARRSPGRSARRRSCRRSPSTTASATSGLRLSSALDRLRRDLLAAGRDEQVLLAVGDRQVAVGVDRADVAGVEPAVAGALRRSRPACCSSRVMTLAPRARISPSSAIRSSTSGTGLPTAADAQRVRRVDGQDRARSRSGRSLR